MAYRSVAARHLAAIGLIAGVQALAPPGWAQSNSFDPTFGNRTEKPDGSVALSVGRRIQSEWDTKFGVDANLAPETGPAGLADRMLQGSVPNHSSGKVWGNVTGPGVGRLFWDKTSVDARLDPAQEHGQVSATMSRTLTLSDNASVTLQDKYSVTQSLGGGPTQSAVTAIPPGASTWETERSLRFNLTPTGTTLSAGVGTLSGESQWHNRISAEQQLGRPLSVTTTVTNPASATPSKSISARFKHTW